MVTKSIKTIKIGLSFKAYVSQLEDNMKRNIISIDEKKCVGCGLCVTGCHQGALEIVNGKAKLVSETYCDGLGMCLPSCPTGALKVIEKEVEAFEEHHKKEAEKAPASSGCSGGCPSTVSKTFNRGDAEKPNTTSAVSDEMPSQLGQWPCQIKLVPVNAPYFDNARLLVAADCTAFANANIHQTYMKNKITIIGCPKLDMVDYAEKLTEILKHNNIKSVDVLRMSVPCCGGIEQAVKKALIDSGKMIPWQVVTISTDGTVLDV